VVLRNLGSSCIPQPDPNSETVPQQYIVLFGGPMGGRAGRIRSTMLPLTPIRQFAGERRASRLLCSVSGS